MSGYVSFIDFSTIATPRDDPYSRYTYKKQRSDDNACSQQDLLALVDSLRLELRVKESRLRDMEEYMDNLERESIVWENRKSCRVRFFRNNSILPIVLQNIE
ncbi:hypothetical protein Y032_0004g1914 [Ancylostoma ceylanicum]|uniref:Uncharacterized protein n=1 Tax=Ancylostoma ceylanicum TaxID=53326 RepID=A0A016VUJ5_9BILA|nr:hypothetical protein Y032_0004g1914 [Ancylostoma ceylanicum]